MVLLVVIAPPFPLIGGIDGVGGEERYDGGSTAPSLPPIPSRPETPSLNSCETFRSCSIGTGGHLAPHPVTGKRSNLPTSIAQIFDLVWNICHIFRLTRQSHIRQVFSM
jgi:hypothetical protein